MIGSTTGINRVTFVNHISFTSRATYVFYCIFRKQCVVENNQGNFHYNLSSTFISEESFRGLFNKTFILVIYKCSCCFQRLETTVTLVNYTCKSFFKLTPGFKIEKCGYRLCVWQIRVTTCLTTISNILSNFVQKNDCLICRCL